MQACREGTHKGEKTAVYIAQREASKAVNPGGHTDLRFLAFRILRKQICYLNHLVNGALTKLNLNKVSLAGPRKLIHNSSKYASLLT